MDLSKFRELMTVARARLVTPSGVRASNQIVPITAEGNDPPWHLTVSHSHCAVSNYDTIS